MASQNVIEASIEIILKEIGRFGEAETQDTPKRFAKALIELTTPEDFNFTVFEAGGCDEMVISKDIPFYTLCAHHMLPFYGVAHVAYIPNQNIVGLSKLARTVKHFSRGLNTQEFLTSSIAQFINEKLSPKGVGVVMRGTHMCQLMRGIQSPGMMITSSMLGVFRDDISCRQEFLSFIK
jgi:GTP cyclohydrolase I